MKKIETIENKLKNIDYKYYEKGFTPSTFALEYVNFIKLVNGGSEENKTPPFHLEMIDGLNSVRDVLMLCFRGASKTSVASEYFILYLAVYGKIANIPNVNVGMYISDTMENGVQSLRDNLEFRYENSEFLKKYVPKARFTDKEWEFKNINGKELCFRGFGANVGVRGFKRYGVRPQILILDDLMSDKSAESPTIIQDIYKTVYKASRAAMHAKYRKVIWVGTPFNKKDPLYQACHSPSWETKVFPICEKFPCPKEEFVGAWEDRFSYDFVLNEYETLKGAGQVSAFNQELMLRIMSEEDRLVQDEDIHWYENRDYILDNKEQYNFYITTDFATSEKERADYTVISVWALDWKGVFYWVDGILKRQTFDKTVDDLFRLADMYKPQNTGVEVTGQQQGFISIIEKEMLIQNKWFSIASDKKTHEKGIRPNTDKLSRFQAVLPLIKTKSIRFPKALQQSKIMIEAIDELSHVTFSGFKSVHDDFCDTISQLLYINTFEPINPELIVKENIVEKPSILDRYYFYNCNEEEKEISSYFP